MSKRKTYLQNAALLTGSGLVLRALGMGFRVVLAAYLGGEGMGLYQLILALYMVFVSFATAGINVASARLAAQSLARGSGMAETLRGLCFTALGFGTTAMVAQAVLAGPCARYLLHDIRAETALLILAPSLPFMAVSGAVRGCFLAARRVQPNITAQLIEQLVRMAVAVAGLRALAQWGAGYGCAAVLLGNTVSEGVSCGVMLAFAARTPEFVPRPGAPLHPYTRSLISAIPLPDPQLEKHKVLYTYDPGMHHYTDASRPELVDIGHGHLVYGSPGEIAEYRALRERGEPLKTLSIVGVNTEAAPESVETEPTSGEVILDRPVHDTGSPWYAILSFLLPILGLIAAFVFRRHNYIRNYKACRKGVVAFAVTLAACAAVLLLFIVIAIL